MVMLQEMNSNTDFRDLFYKTECHGNEIIYNINCRLASQPVQLRQVFPEPDREEEAGPLVQGV